MTPSGQSNGGTRWNALWGTGGRGGHDSRGRRAFLAAAVVLLGLVMAAPATAGRIKDLTPPETTITGGPADGTETTQRSVTFTFASTERGRFECKVDQGTWGRCSHKASHTVTVAWPPAPHTFSVRAVDGAGNVDATPETRGWMWIPWISTVDYPADSLHDRAQDAPLETFRVIVETNSKTLVNALALFAAENGRLKREYRIIDAINAKLPGWAVLAAEEYEAFGNTHVTEDLPVRPVGEVERVWQQTIGVDELWSRDAVTCAEKDTECVPLPAYLAPKAPTIAVVDSGIQPDRVEEFGSRVLASVAISGDVASPNDEHGHGTFVASIAAGASSLVGGVSPSADIVSLRVMDATGAALTSDVIAAADWILANKDTYNIRVANFSLHSARPNSFKFDPLDHAVERLWFNGVVVVAASGNFGTGERTGMHYAPGNDPFVITVGAAGVNATTDVADDDVAPWSAFGYTADGFAKPDVVAPGRFMIGAVPPASTLPLERPEKVVADGFMRISGTSFSAPVVAGAAAQLLALHPDWTPDDVKGALMLTARPLNVTDPLMDGVGEIDVAAAAGVTAPPNPNAPLNGFVVANPDVPGGLAFDTAAWSDAAWADAAWADAAWADAAWYDAAWYDAAWYDAAWADASFASAAWADAAEADAALPDAAWADAAWYDAAWSE